jgi:hypothetical protein
MGQKSNQNIILLKTENILSCIIVIITIYIIILINEFHFYHLLMVALIFISKVVVIIIIIKNYIELLLFKLYKSALNLYSVCVCFASFSLFVLAL